jgi:choline-sulfatase
MLPPAPPNLRDLERLPSALDEDRRKHEDRTEFEWRQYLWVYYRLVESSDQLIGRILDALDRNGLASNTVVVFTSDHGEMSGAHGMVSKQKLYEESVAVPLIIAAPGTRPGVDRQHLVGGIDLMPTFLDYAGIAAPGSLEGCSLRPLVEGKGVAWRDFIAAETFGPESRMIRTDRYKYIAFADGERREQLFDEETDPGEIRNLVDDPRMVDVLARHRRLLEQWMAASGDLVGKGTHALEMVKRWERSRSRATTTAE